MLRIFFLTNISPERSINVAVIIFFYKTCIKKKAPKCLYCIAFMIFRFVISVPKLLQKM